MKRLLTRGRHLTVVSTAISCAFAVFIAGAGAIADASPVATSPSGYLPSSASGGTRLMAQGTLPIGVGDPHGSSNAQVTFTPNTVVVSPAQVRSSLVGVSADGSTYTFSGATGPLAKLAPGKVLLLEGFDAAQVTKVTRSGPKLVVVTTPASLPSLIQSGNIDVNTPPDFSGAFGSDVTADPAASLAPASALRSLSAGFGRRAEISSSPTAGATRARILLATSLTRCP